MAASFSLQALLDLTEVLSRVLQKRREWDDVLWLKLEELQQQINKLYSAQNDCKKLVAMIETINTENREPKSHEPLFLDPI